MMVTGLGEVASPPQAFSEAQRQQVIAFLYAEARCADESRYDDWLGLVDDEEMLYWVPIAHAHPDPDRTASLIADNRKRLGSRIAQLKTGRRLAQQPASPMRRHLSNIELDRISEREVRVCCNFVIHEYRAQSEHRLHLWAGRYEYRLRDSGKDGLRMYYKRADLVDAAAPIPSLAFLI
jgi:3-phenylpropionate/cinnamic acid dioxygenase small subunit